jgi:hypothetical protein
LTTKEEGDGNGIARPVIPPAEHQMAGKGKTENLRPPWKPGESGNPSGRPKKRLLSDTYGEFGQQLLPEKLRLRLGFSEGATFADALTQGLFLSAINGNVAAARELREAIEGKAIVRPRDAVAEEVTVRVVYETTPRVKRPDPDNSGSDGSGNGTA